MKKRKAFTLIEVLAALALIIVLTLTLVVTIQGQVQQAQRRQSQALIETTNAQITIAYEQPDRVVAEFASPAELVRAGIISANQQTQLAAVATYTASPPAYHLK
ncbi:prepilin-type N-terminal cleavage/methylation domain-containing protein [Lacticaseibacillus jixianensis]|uniref:Prepilin-type N-terminal cleavage/methylation domain-containing protein n=1 Tax=Lacticaseibacillus jixianensis TaxID=2486012 RepID=A0ABW4B574_9LACO|nr:type II secretion system protein [Lacticaseibacillus jixianensis]